MLVPRNCYWTKREKNHRRGNNHNNNNNNNNNNHHHHHNNNNNTAFSGREMPSSLTLPAMMKPRPLPKPLVDLVFHREGDGRSGKANCCIEVFMKNPPSQIRQTVLRIVSEIKEKGVESFEVAKKTNLQQFQSLGHTKS